MPMISSDTIRDISVKSVEMFLNDKVPLSQGLAKQASAYELNSEQIQRAVEATNSIAYLKVLGLSSDRTVEFPLCKYAEVMTNLVVPEMDKQASVTLYKTSAVGKTSLDLEKFAKYVPPSLNDAEQRVHMIKMAAATERKLEQLQDRATTIVPEIEKVASVIKADPQGLEKLATIADGQEFKFLTALVYGSVKEHSDTGLFKSAELKDVERISELYKEAKQVQSDTEYCRALLTRTEQVKEASLAGAIGSGIGKVVGTVAAAPVKLVGKAAANTGHNMANKVKSVVGTATGKPVAPTMKKKGLGALASTAAVGAFDATMYTPGKTVNTGTSKDVWDALQR